MCAVLVWVMSVQSSGENCLKSKFSIIHEVGDAPNFTQSNESKLVITINWLIWVKFAYVTSSGSSGLVGEGLRNMKSMWLPLEEILFMTSFYRTMGRGGGDGPLLSGSPTGHGALNYPLMWLIYVSNFQVSNLSNTNMPTVLTLCITRKLEFKRCFVPW